MFKIKEFRPGIHMAFADSKITKMDTGIFITYDPNWGDRMDALKNFLTNWYSATPDDAQYLFEDHIHLREIVGKHPGQCEIPADGEGSSQDKV